MNYALRYRFKGGSVAWTTLGRGAEPSALFKAHAHALGQMPERATREALEVEVVNVADARTPVLSSTFYPNESLACVGDLKMDLGGPDPDLMSVLSEEQKEALWKRLKPTVAQPQRGPVDENIVPEEEWLIQPARIGLDVSVKVEMIRRALCTEFGVEVVHANPSLSYPGFIFEFRYWVRGRYLQDLTAMVSEHILQHGPIDEVIHHVIGSLRSKVRSPSPSAAPAGGQPPAAPHRAAGLLPF